MEDIDLNLDDFALRVNSDLVGKYVNIASRTAGFVAKLLEGKLEAVYWQTPEGEEILKATQATGERVATAYEERDYARATREIMRLADHINEYVNDQEPWKLAKDPERHQELARVCTRSLQGFHALSILLAPLLPDLTSRVAKEFFAMDREFIWQDLENPPHHVEPYQHLMTRIDPAQIQGLVEMSRQTLKPTENPGAAAASPIEPIGATLSIEDFGKIDLRVARIVEAEHVEGAAKLLRLTLDLGEETRNVFAGIKSAYEPEDLKGRLTIMVANLAPRQMKFGLSEGMVLAAGDSRGGPFILAPDDGATPGMRVK